MVARSSRRSSLVPTRIIGTLGAWCSISGYHCSDCQSGSLAGGGSVEQARGSNLGFDVVEGRRADDGKANEENVGLRVGQWSETVVILLSRCIP